MSFLALQKQQVNAKDVLDEFAERKLRLSFFNITLDLFFNGRRKRWNGREVKQLSYFESLIDFFLWSSLPKRVQVRLKKYRLRLGAVTAINASSEGVEVRREFYTFRFFVVHYYCELINLFKKLVRIRIYVLEPAIACSGGVRMPFGYSFSIAFNASSKFNSTTAGETSNTVSHTATGSDLAAVALYGAVDGNRLSSIVYDGNTMTAQVDRNDADYKNCSIRTLASPPTGAKNVVFNYTAAQTTKKGYVMTFTGTNTASLIDITASGTSATGAPSVSITTGFDNSFICSVVSQADNNPGAAGMGQTVLGSDFGNSHYTDASRELKATAGADTQSWTTGGSSGWSMGCCAIREAAVVVFPEIHRVTEQPIMQKVQVVGY